ncbi:MAG: NTP transferase domain-containing protein [Acidaminococcales bacterium]|jgi:aminoglycoside phosphotransferase|nr:NTP transferase domain-containing protein [Acidaminococcales bacterium]
MKIVVQAGGRGSRLEQLTRNKPKCLVPVSNLPILFYAFRQFPAAEFTVIADYKMDVLEKYLAAFASQYRYRIVRARKKGTAAGIREAVLDFGDDERFMLLWCDLILSEDFNPEECQGGNYIGISCGFECRWSYEGGQFSETPSKENGVAGVFVFESKKSLAGLPEEGAFVSWLQGSGIPFRRLELRGCREVGTALSYADNNAAGRRCRPFNSIEFDGDTVTKRAVTEQGKAIAQDEAAWYKYVKGLGYQFVPEIYEYDPLTMKRVQGKNIWEYDCLTRSQKKTVLSNIIGALKKLHGFTAPRPASAADVEECYVAKTFERIGKVEKLVPFADREFVRINGRYYKNVFFGRENFAGALGKLAPEEFRLIHGDCTFSNVMFDTYDMKTVLIDPRGYFGKSKFFGDADYDWAKLYYSLKGNYDQFNMKKFTLDIGREEVEFFIKPNNWEDMEEYFFDQTSAGKGKIRALHAAIWLSLTTYAWEDYDSICGAFYNGLIQAEEML